MILNKIALFFFFTLSIFANENSKKQMMETGKAIYEQTCISCHGINGETNSEMKLVVRPRKLNKTILSQKESFLIIKKGARYWGAHSDIMPAFEYIYDDKEIAAVTLYIYETFNPKRDKRVKKLLRNSKHITNHNRDKVLKTGKKIFEKDCSRCHGTDGKGNSEYIEKSKKSDIFIYPYNLTRTLLGKDEIFLYTKYGSQYWGTDKNDMPSLQHKYNNFELKSVAEYITKKIKKVKP